MPITELRLQQMRSVAIAASGLCMAIVLVLVQLDATDLPALVALYGAAIGIPAWIAAWQYVQAFIVHGASSYQRYTDRSAATLLVGASMPLLIAIAALIWHVSSFASGVFLVACLCMAVFSLRHHRAVSG